MGIFDALRQRVKTGKTNTTRVNPVDARYNIYNSTGHERDVRNHLLVSSCAYITAKQAGKLAITIHPLEGYENEAIQQIDEWTRFIENTESKLFEQMWSWAWAYNVSFADPCIEKSDRYYITDFVVVPQMSVSATIQGYYYYGQLIDEDRVLKMQFRPESEMSLANQLWPYVSALQSLQRADTLSGVINSVGEKNMRWDPKNPAKNMTQKDYDAAVNYVKGSGEAEFSMTVQPDWRIEVTQPPPEPDFDGKIRRNRQEILTPFNMNWLDASSWVSGTFGSMKVQMITYNEFLYSIRKSWCESLECMAKRLASWNFEPLFIRFDCEKPQLDESALEKMNAVTALKSLNLTPEEQAILYPQVGLPVPEIKEDAMGNINPIIADSVKGPLVMSKLIDMGIIKGQEIRTNIGLGDATVDPAQSQPVETPVKQASLDILNTKYQGALTGFIQQYNKALQNLPWRYDFTGWQTIAEPLKVNPELAKLVWNKYQQKFRQSIVNCKIKRLANDQAKLDFNRIWSELVKDVQAWL